MPGSSAIAVVLFSDFWRMAARKKAVRDVSDASSKFEALVQPRSVITSVTTVL
jgi:hypothetical protein